MSFSKTMAAVAALAALTGAAQAALVDRGGGMIYDSTRNITWLADMNYAGTSGHTDTEVLPGGAMSWMAANNWANNLVYGGFSDWRLPTLNPSDTTCSAPTPAFPYPYGLNCTGGELSGLFVADLGIRPLESVLDQTGDTNEQKANLALFRNIQSLAYWSATAFGAQNSAWYFDTSRGYQGVAGSDGLIYAVAVRTGDVAASVPEPQTLALVLLAVGATVVARRRRPS